MGNYYVVGDGLGYDLSEAMGNKTPNVSAWRCLYFVWQCLSDDLIPSSMDQTLQINVSHRTDHRPPVDELDLPGRQMGSRQMDSGSRFYLTCRGKAHNLHGHVSRVGSALYGFLHISLQVRIEMLYSRFNWFCPMLEMFFYQWPGVALNISEYGLYPLPRCMPPFLSGTP